MLQWDASSMLQWEADWREKQRQMHNLRDRHACKADMHAGNVSSCQLSAVC